MSEGNAIAPGIRPLTRRKGLRIMSKKKSSPPKCLGIAEVYLLEVGIPTEAIPSILSTLPGGASARNWQKAANDWFAAHGADGDLVSSPMIEEAPAPWPLLPTKKTIVEAAREHLKHLAQVTDDNPIALGWVRLVIQDCKRSAEALGEPIDAIERPRNLEEAREALAAILQGASPEKDQGSTRPAKLSPRELSDKYKVNVEALRKRLDRWRYEHDAGYHEVANPARNAPKYLYDESAVMPVIDALKAKPVGRKRATDGQRKKV